MRLTSHPIRNPLRPEAPHIRQPSTAHWEVTNQVPDQSGELEDGRDESEDGGVELFRELAWSCVLRFRIENAVQRYQGLTARCACNAHAGSDSYRKDR